MPYIGHSPTNTGTFYILDEITLGNSAGPYNLTVGGVSVTPKVDNLLIMLDGVVQHAGDAYTISGNQITFSAATASGMDFYGIIMGQAASFAQGSIGADELKVADDGSANQILVSDGDGTFSWATNALNSTHISVADNESTNENNLIPFIEDASATGNVGLESDGDLHYNPSTGRLTATQLAGTLQTAAQTNITSVGSLTGLTIDASDPILTLKSDGDGNANTGYVAWQSDDGTSEGWLGYGSTSDSAFKLYLPSGNDHIEFLPNATSSLTLTSSSATFAGDINMTGGQKKMVLANSSNTPSSMLRISNRSSVTPTWADEYICEIHGNASGTDSEVLMYLKHHENGGDRPILRGVNASNHVIELGSNELYKFKGKLSVGNTIFDASELLHVKGTSGNIYARIETTATNSAAGLYIVGHSGDQSRIYFGDQDNANIGAMVYYHGDDQIRWKTDGTEIMCLDSTGFLGISGEMTPARDIQITRASGEVSMRVGYYEGTNYCDYSYDYLDCVTSTHWDIRMAGDTDFLFYNDGVAKKSSGAGDWANYSDSRLKTNIEDLSVDALATLNSLRPVEFNWKKEELYNTPKDSNGKSYGFIAQEIESTMPQLVTEGELPRDDEQREYVDEDGMAKSTELGHMASLYIKAIQQLTSRIEALENA